MLHVDGYQVLTADNGYTALSMLNEHLVDLVLLDLALPGMDGYEVMRRIRAQPHGEQLPILLVSGRFTASEDVARGLEIGADDFMAKPTNYAELRARIAAKLRQRQLEVELKAARQRADEESRLLQQCWKVMQEAAKCLDPDSLAKTVCRGLVEQFGAAQVAVWRFCEVTATFIPFPADAPPLPAATLESVKRGEPTPQQPGRVLLPMRLSGVLVGFIDLRHLDEWAESALPVLRSLADALAILFQNTRYVQQMVRENRFNELLNRVAWKGMPLTDMLREAGQFLRLQLFLVDRWLNLVAGEPVALLVEGEHIVPQVAELYQEKQLVTRGGRSTQPVAFERRGGFPAHHVVPVVQSSEPILLLVAVPMESKERNEVSDSELERIARFVAHSVERQRESALREQQLRADFLNELFAERSSDDVSRTSLFLRANGFGLNLLQPGFVAQMELPRLKQHGEWSARQVEQYVIDLLDPLLRDARRVRASLGYEGIEVVIADRVVAVVSLPRHTTEDQARTSAARWAQQLLASHRQRTTSDESPAIGLGRLATSWHDLARSASEAGRALRWALSNARTTVAYYGDLGSERLLAAVNDREELERFCEEQLGPVIEYDRSREGELVHTLEVFFANGGHMARAAQMLAIHPNTLKYRLDQVMHLTGRDPRDASISLDLQLALKIYGMF